MKNNSISKLGVQKNKISGVPAQIGIGAGIENSKYQNKAKLQNSHDANSQLYSELSKSFESKAGGRPRGVWNNIGSGFMKGMAHAEKLNSINKREGDYDFYERNMNYWNDVNNSAMERRAWYEQRAMEMEAIQPYAIAGLEVSYSGMDYATGNERMRNLVEQAKINNPNIKGDYIGYVPNSPIVNLRDESGNITALSLSTLAGEDAVKRVQGNYIDQQSRNVAQQKQQQEYEQKEKELKAKYPNYGKKDGEARAPEPFEFNGNSYEAVPLTGLEKSEKSDYGKSVNKAVSQIPINENAVKSVNSMREVFKRNENIGSSFIHMLNLEDEGAISTWIKKQFVSDQERADMEILKKASSDLNLSTILSVPGKSATDLLKQTIRSASPTGTLTKKAFDKIADEWEERAFNNIDMARAQAHARAQGKMIVQKNKTENVDDWSSLPGVTEIK